MSEFTFASVDLLGHRRMTYVSRAVLLPANATSSHFESFQWSEKIPVLRLISLNTCYENPPTQHLGRSSWP